MEEGLGVGADLHRLRGGQPARAALRCAGRLRLHRTAGERAGRDRRRAARPGRLADRVLLRWRGRARRRDRGLGRPQVGHRQAAGGDRRPGRQLHPVAGGRAQRRAGGGAGRPVRAVPAGRRRGWRPGQHPRGHRPRRADQREGRRAARRTVLGPRAGHRPGVRVPGGGQGRSLRAVRHHGGSRGQQGDPAHREPVQVDDAGDGDPRAGPAAADPAAGHRQGRRRRGDPGAERPLRPLHQEGHRLALAGERGGAVRGDPRRGARDLRPAQAAGPGGGQGAAQGAGCGPGQPGPGHRAGGPIRSLRHRRRGQREPAEG